MEFDDDGGTNAGAVWILFLNSDGTVAEHTKISDTSGGFDGGLSSGNFFGTAMSGLGDLNGNGTRDIVVGASQDGTGAVWVLFLDNLVSGPDIELAPAVVDFGNVNAFTSRDMIATISNTSLAADLTLSEISLSGDASFAATPLLSTSEAPIVLAPEGVIDVTITFFPTSVALHEGLLAVVSDDPDEPSVSATLLGNGLEGAVEEQATVLETAVDDAIDAGTLEGSGSGSSANGRLNAFANMIEAAGDLIEAGLIEDACGQLRSALRRVDGDPRPPDFVTGTDAELIEAQITLLLSSLGCNN